MRADSTVRASLWYTVSNLIGRGAGFAFTPVFTRLLSPEEYGIYSLYISWLGIFTVVGTLEIPGNVMYRTLSRFEGEDKAVVSAAIGVELMLAALLSAVYIIFRGAINAVTALSLPLTLMLILQVLLTSVQGIFFAKQRYSYSYKAVALINTGSGILTPVLAFIMIRSGLGGISRVLSPIIISLAFALPIIIHALKGDRHLFSSEKWRYLLKLALPMLPNYLALSLIAGGDKIIITHIMNEGAIGKYSAAYSVGFTVSLITGGISAALIPRLMRELADGRGRSAENRIALLSDGVTALILLFLSVAPEVFAFAAPREYYDAFSAIYPVALSTFFLFLSGVLSGALLHYEKPFKITRNSLISSAVFLLLALFLVERYGYIGGGAATLMGYILLFTLNLITFKRVSGYSLVNVKSYLQSSAFLITFAFLFYITRAVAVSRFMLALAVVMIFLPKLYKLKKKAD